MGNILLLEDDMSLISGLSFVRLTGEENYVFIMIQTTRDVTDEDAWAIQTKC